MPRKQSIKESLGIGPRRNPTFCDHENTMKKKQNNQPEGCMCVNLKKRGGNINVKEVREGKKGLIKRP